jgi:hypothetical protein
LANKIEWRNGKAKIYGRKIITKRKVAWNGENAYEYTYADTAKYALLLTMELLELKKL